MIYLDTHVVLWLYGGLTQRFPVGVQAEMNANDLLISPIVMLELAFLQELGRFTAAAESILSDLAGRTGLTVCNETFHDVVAAAAQQTWTRDPFDRVIVGHAALRQRKLVSKDRVIRAQYPLALWPDED